MINQEIVYTTLEDDVDFEKIKSGNIILIEGIREDINEITPLAINLLTERSKAIIILTEKSYFESVSTFRKQQVGIEQFFFIDCVSKTVQKENQREIDISSLTRLNDIFITTFQELNKINSNKIVCIDTLNALVNANKFESVAKFLHVLFTKLRSNGVGCLIVSSKNSMKDDVRAEIIQLFDKVIHF